MSTTEQTIDSIEAMNQLALGTVIKVYSRLPHGTVREWRKESTGWRAEGGTALLPPPSFTLAVREGLVRMDGEEEGTLVVLASDAEPEARTVGMMAGRQAMRDAIAAGLATFVDEHEDEVPVAAVIEWLGQHGIDAPPSEVEVTIEVTVSHEVNLIPDPDDLNRDGEYEHDRYGGDFGTATVEYKYEVSQTVPRTSRDSCDDIEEEWIEARLEEEGLRWDEVTIDGRRCSQCSF